MNPLRKVKSREIYGAIGIFHGAEVWVKPWAIANFAFAWDAASPQKPLVFRQRTQTSLQGLRIAATLGDGCNVPSDEGGLARVAGRGQRERHRRGDPAQA